LAWDEGGRGKDHEKLNLQEKVPFLMEGEEVTQKESEKFAQRVEGMGG